MVHPSALREFRKTVFAVFFSLLVLARGSSPRSPLHIPCFHNNWQEPLVNGQVFHGSEQAQPLHSGHGLQIGASSGATSQSTFSLLLNAQVGYLSADVRRSAERKIGCLDGFQEACTDKVRHVASIYGAREDAAVGGLSFDSLLNTRSTLVGWQSGSAESQNHVESDVSSSPQPGRDAMPQGTEHETRDVLTISAVLLAIPTEFVAALLLVAAVVALAIVVMAPAWVGSFSHVRQRLLLSKFPYLARRSTSVVFSQAESSLDNSTFLAAQKDVLAVPRLRNVAQIKQTIGTVKHGNRQFPQEEIWVRSDIESMMALAEAATDIPDSSEDSPSEAGSKTPETFPEGALEPCLRTAPIFAVNRNSDHCISPREAIVSPTESITSVCDAGMPAAKERLSACRSNSPETTKVLNTIFIKSVDKTNEVLASQIRLLAKEAFGDKEEPIRAKSSEHLAVLLFEGEVVSYALYMVRRDLLCLSVNKLAVARAHLRRGLGRTMLRNLIQLAKCRSRGEAPVRAVCLSALPTSISFYKACGFHEDTSVQLSSSGDAIEGQVYMEYHLRGKRGK